MLIAYHGREADKIKILRQLADHRAADELVQGYGYWRSGRGCAVGCTLHSNDHMEYEVRFGIPVAIARLEDVIFEGLPVDLARAWPERLMTAVRPGSDLSRVHWHLLDWLLTTPSVNPGIEHPLVRDAVRQCADVVAEMAAGEVPDASAARSAARSADSAMWSAASVAWSAASVARSADSVARSAASAAWSAASVARSAESAAWSAESAAWSAASVARSAESAVWSAQIPSAARSAVWTKISDRLIALIDAAPVAVAV